MIRCVDSSSRRSSSREQGFKLLGGLVAVMWVLELADLVADLDLDRFGIRPRDAGGLDGVVLHPLLHGDLGHLIGNTIPLVLLGAVVALSGAFTIAAVLAVVTLVGGLGTWLVAPEETIHIGASGIVFGLAAYLVVRGFLTRNLLHLLVGVIVVAVWGTTLLRGLVPETGISWQGHVFGAVGGVVAANLLSRRRRAPSPSG